MNKAELIEALAARLGDKRAATQALDAVLAEIQAAVTKGDRVAITGFGAFEKRVRGARTARNPRTGESVKVKKTSVPAFKAGAGFKEMVASGKVPKAAAAKKTTGAAKATTSRATTSRATTSRATGAKSTAAKATKATKSTAARSTATRSTAAKSTATKATAKKAPAKASKAAAKSTSGRTTTTAKATKSAAKAPAKKAAAKRR